MDRRELKKKVVRKKEKEAVINKLYAYMHDIFGAEVLELFDMEYDPEEKYRKKETEAQEAADSEAEPANEETQTPES